MTGGFHVEPEQLASHSETVNGVAEGVTEIAAAAGTEGFGGLVYGVLFDPIALTALNAWAERIRGLITQDAEVGRAIAAGIKSNADTYAGIEQANMSTVQQSGAR